MANALKWGLIFSSAALLWYSLEFLFGMHDRYIALHPMVSNLFAIPAAVIIVSGILEKKRTHGGRISYRKSLSTGTGISLVVAALSPAVLWIFTQWINPDFFPAMIRHSLSVGMHADDGEAANHFNLQNYALMSMLAAPVMGLIVSSIAGLFIRTRSR